MSFSSMSLRARRLAVDAVVGAHERVRAAFANAHLEVRQIALAQIALADDGVERVALRLGAAVHGEMLHRRDGLEVLRIVALQAANELHARAVPVRNGSSPYVSWPRPQRGSRKMLMFGDQNVRP